MKRLVLSALCLLVLCGCSVTISTDDDKTTENTEPIPVVITTPSPTTEPTPTPVVETPTPEPTKEPDLKHAIEILNGSAIDGLSSTYQQMIVADGLYVVNIGNYTGVKQTRTTIYTKSVKWAKRLKKYFPKKVKIEHSNSLEEGIHTMIILGTDADVN